MKHIFSIILIMFIIGVSVVSCGKKDGNTAETLSESIATEKNIDSSTPYDTTVVDTELVTGGTVYTETETTSSTVGTEDTEIITTPSEDEVTLELYAGWWGRPDGYIETEMTVSDAIYVDARTETWTIYSKYGAKGDSYSCYLNDGVLILDYGDEGYIPLDYKDGMLLNIYRMTEYVRCDPLEEVDTEMFEGKWFRYDDTEDTYYEVKHGICSFTENGNITFIGEWYSRKENKFILETGEITEEQFVVTDDIRTTVFAVSDAGGVIYDPVGKAAYIHESVIETEKGEDLIRKYTLVCGKWQDVANNNTYIVFDYYEGNLFVENLTDNGDGNITSQSSKIGTWSLDGYELILKFNDGTEEITPFDPEEIRVSTFNVSYKFVK